MTFHGVGIDFSWNYTLCFVFSVFLIYVNRFLFAVVVCVLLSNFYTNGNRHTLVFNPPCKALLRGKYSAVAFIRMVQVAYIYKGRKQWLPFRDQGWNIRLCIATCFSCRKSILADVFLPLMHVFSVLYCEKHESTELFTACFMPQPSTGNKCEVIFLFFFPTRLRSPPNIRTGKTAIF